LFTRFGIAVVLCLSAYSQDVRITSGLAAHQVVQRGADGRGVVHVSGTAPVGSVELRYVPGGSWTKMAGAQGGQWSGELTGIPAGGPYKVEVRAGGATAVIDDVYVGDLWILAGQSNMEGVGDLADVQKPDPMVHTFDMFDQWAIATEPLHNLPGAVDRVHWRKNPQGELERLTGEALATFNANRKKGAGLGLPFAVEMVRRTGIPVGLVPCAHGGTSMDQWSPALKDKAGDSLYGAMLRRFHEVGGHVTGVLWYQGESDANPKAAPLFQDKFEKFVVAVRDDFGQPNMPFYYVQIGRHVDRSNVAEWNAVQEYQRTLAQSIPHAGMVPSVDSALDDGIHVSTQDQKRMGKRLAVLATRDLFPAMSDYGQQKGGPRPVSANFASGILKLIFDGVNGRLQSEGRIAGFTIHDAQGQPVPMIYKARFDPADGNIIYLHLSGRLPEGATIRYGFGKDPYCNVTDSKDMGMPVFGPMVIAQ
jgi:sialate O-acetylesterase